MQGNGNVFISHAHADNERCAPLLAALAAWGVDYWFDVASMEAGADLSTRIQQAIQERDVFIRVCTAAAQQSYWVRMETGAFRGLQAEAHREGQDGRRVLINLILDPAYQREPFDLAAIFIDATNQPLSAWLDELRRALRLNTPTVGPAVDSPAAQELAARQAPAAPPSASAGAASDLAGLSGAAVPSAPAPVPGGGITTPTAQPGPHTTAASPAGPNNPSPAPAQPPRRNARTRILVPAAVVFAVIVAFVVVTSLLENQRSGVAGAQIHASPTPTWTLPPTLTPTATLVLTPAPMATPQGTPPLDFHDYSSPDAYFSINIPNDGWGTGHPEGYCQSCGGYPDDLPGPPSDTNAFALIQLLTDQWAGASNDQVVNNADGWFLVQGGVTEQNRVAVKVGGESCVRGEFTANNGSFTAWLFGCHHANHEYMMYFRASPSNWNNQSGGDITFMVNSIQWQ